MSGSSRVAALVLAAGRGARFSKTENKLLVNLDGAPLLRRTTAAAVASRAFKTIVVTGRAHADTRAALAGLPLAYAHNPRNDGGIATSLRVGVAAAGDAEGVLVLLGDMPGVSAQTLDALIGAFEGAPERMAVVPICDGRRGNPVLLARAIFPRLAALEGDEGARSILHSSDGVLEIEVADKGVLYDVDTPEDLDQIAARIRRS